MAHSDIPPLPPRLGRSHSISSDRPSLTGYGGLMSPPPSTSPDPVFIALSAASQIVTNDYDSRSESWLDQHGIEPSGETALVAPAALKLVNRFLDQLLFNFLATAKSTTLVALRPAVSDVLKPKLAKDAINGADQELHEYLGGGDDEEIMALHNGLEVIGDWDLELIWKRTRLRCMVYSSLGDMEEEDEDFYMERENLETPLSSSGRFPNTSNLLSPAVAIFLTSILEFIGEQVLVVAGQASYQRFRARLEKEAKDGNSTPADTAERLIVEEGDMERVALDRTLGRLWRGWKKRIRSPTTSVSMTRSFSRDSFGSQAQTSRAASIAPDELVDEEDPRPSLAAVLAEYEHAAAIPLPTSTDDIREIEIPGLVIHSDDEDSNASDDEETVFAPRPKSFAFFDHQEQLKPALARIQSLSAPRTRPISLPPPIRKVKHQIPQAQEASGEDQEDTSDAEADDQVDGEVSDDSREADEEKATANQPKRILANAASNVVAVGATAVAGIIAVANGRAPETDIDNRSETDAEEEFTEEAQIMTSSRISIGDRISPDDVNATLGHSSSRSRSIHSLRVIEVSSKSPTVSRTSSISRPSSIYSPPLESAGAKASPMSQSPGPGGLHARGKSSLTPPPARSSAGGSISEVEERELYESDSDQMTAIPAELAAAMQGLDVELSPPHPQIASTEVSREPKPQPVPFALAAAPPPRHQREQKIPVNGPQPSHTTGRLGSVSKNSAAENGASPLTPLREAAEIVQETPTPPAASTHGRSTSERGVNGRYSPSAAPSTISNGQRQAEQPRPPRPQNRIITQGSPSRSVKGDAGRKAPDQPRSQKSIHSQSPGSSSSHKFRPTRASEDDGSISASDKGQSFEQLIRSDQTIQYTLTPETMRNIEYPDSPRNSPRYVATNTLERPPTNRSHTSVTKLTGLRSNPPEVSSQPPKSASGSSNFTGGPRPRTNGPQPRDARADRDSIGDFAEFIRSTGPANSYEQIPPRAAPSHRGANGTARNFSASASGLRAHSETSLPRRSESSAGRKKLQARGAVATKEDSVSDLIDFVRSGPQLEKQGHRIPRTVAPFRTTMDSDVMSGAAGGRAVDANLPEPRYSQTSTSVESSIHSQSALLKHAAANKPSPSLPQMDPDEEDMMPKRKTRRVLDPYAIDYSDDEDEFDMGPVRPPPKEESLADFLRNAPPPPDPIAKPIYQDAPKPPRKDVKKKSSTPSLMSRFTRTGSLSGGPKPRSLNSRDSRSLNSRGRTASASNPSAVKPGGANYTPVAAKFITISNPPREANHRNENYATQVGSARGNSRVPRKTYQARDAVVMPNTRTSDLAEFLMSEPPSAMQAQPRTFAPDIQKEEASTFSKMFSRRKV